jgi:hypothetical protein
MLILGLVLCLVIGFIFGTVRFIGLIVRAIKNLATPAAGVLWVVFWLITWIISVAVTIFWIFVIVIVII